MTSWIFGEYFYKTELIKIIDEIDEKRKEQKKKGKTMKSSFAQDLKNALNGVEEQLEKMLYEGVEEKKKSSSDSQINYNNLDDENLKLYIQNQFKNA